MRHSRFAWLILALLLAQAPAWADGAHPDPGYLRQTVLVILRFPPAGAADELTLADESSIAAELNIASDFLWTQSDQSLRVNFHVVKMLKPLAASDYKNYGTAGYVGMFNKPVAEFLLHRHINPRKYAGIVMIYRPTNAPGGLFYNTWIWFTDEIPSLASQKKHPGFSSIFYSSTYNPGWLSELLVHEYLHQLDHRFDKEAHNPDGFMNADDKTNPPGLQLEVLLGTTFPSNPSWYAAMLKYYLGPLNTLHRVNYRWLDGIRGVVFKPGELKTSYDFARLYDTLERVSGDDISLANPENPASFRFRAAAGHTAAFGTQTAYGRYLLKQVAFNYEIAPDDYTFQVHVVYYDNLGNVVDKRIDDGIYALGHPGFATNRKVITLATPAEVEDFRIVFTKGNQLGGAAADDDWVRLGKITLETSAAP